MEAENQIIKIQHIEEVDTLVLNLIEGVTSYMKNVPREVIHDAIWRSYEFAKAAHDGQMRKSGNPYIVHPVRAAQHLLILKPDIVTIQSCILHDVAEDTERTILDIEKEFWKDVAHICEWLTKLSTIKYRWEERSVGSLRKMLLAMVDDLRVVLVKLADRLHNMKTLQFHPDPKKRERIALETLNIYAPIADRLGIFDFKEALETECFRILYPEEFIRIQNELNALKEEQTLFITKVKDLIHNLIQDALPVIDISYRIKSPYSIYKKMERKNYESVRDLYDLFAIRIITDNIPHCYEVLGMMHNAWTPIPRRFKDYIALPKENGYQSLHTSVVGIFPEFRDQPTEIQIRTPEMHRQAEIWVAAHFEYSETGKSVMSNDTYWVRTIKSILDNAGESPEFLSEMKMNVFSDQIFVFTPKGDIITLPKGSTPVDFAYAIHSELWNHLVIAKANGQVVPLDYALHNGENVQIVTDKNKRPSLTWLSFVKTSRAREVIRQTINREQREQLIEKGRFILQSYLEKNYWRTLDKDLSILKNLDGRILDMKQRDDVLVQLGLLSRKPGSVMKSLHNDVLKALWERRDLLASTAQKTDNTAQKTEAVSQGVTSEQEEIIIGGEKNIPYKIAQCCSPNSSHRIVAYVSHGGVMIHKYDCSSIVNGDFDRCIPSRWSSKPQQGVTFTMEFIVEDKLWVLKKITEILYQMQLNIESLAVATLPNGLGKDTITLRTDDEDYYIYERLIERMKFDVPEFREAKLISMN